MALRPGNRLITLNDDEDATRIAADVMKRISKPAPENFNCPSTHDWFLRLNHPVALPANFAKELFTKANIIANDLHMQTEENVLLHGDLHHFNILSAKRQPWLAIDPKGVIGPPEYEVGALLRNPIPHIAKNINIKQIWLLDLNGVRVELNFAP